MLFSGAALAQTARSLPGSVEPGRDQPLPLPSPTTPDFELTIESMQRASSADTADQLKFQLNGVLIKGATTYSKDQLAPLYAPLVGKQVKLADIEAVAEAIESRYRADGYVLTRAYVPPQRVHDGIFEIDVVEGYVSAVAVSTHGGKPLIGRSLETLVGSYFTEVRGERPLADATIERAMLLANDLPGYTASGVLRPASDVPGASDLLVTMNRQGFAPTFSVDNRGSKFAGPVLLHLGAGISPDILAGDQLTGAIDSTPDSLERIDGALNYAFPIGDHGAIASFNGSGSYGKPGASLSPISLVTSSYSYGPHIRFPFLRSKAQSLYFDAGFSVRYANVQTLGQPLSHDNWRTFDASLTYVQSGWGAGAMSASLTVTQGLPIFGASRDHSLDLSRPGAAIGFTKIAIAAQRIQRLSGPFSLFFKLQGQYAFEPLIAGEQIAFGGDTIGRGYDPAALLGDHGFGGGVELRYDHAFQSGWLKSIEPYLFSDTGAVWDRRARAPDTSRLSSAGAGLRFELTHHITADVEVARDLVSVADNNDGRRETRALFDLGITL